MASKRKCTSHSVAFKLETISRIRNGKESQTKVARELGIPESTIRGWLKNEDKLRSYVDEVDHEVGMSRKRARVSQDPVLDSALFGGFCAKRADGVPLSGPILQTMAAQMSQEIHGSSSTPQISKGWLDRWKARHGIRAIRITGEVRSADSAAAEAFLPELQRVVESESLVPDQIWNADETGLYWRMTPDHTLAARSDSRGSQGHKQAKERVTVLLACNWTGAHKLRPLVIGKSRSPRCFHHVNMEALPIVYSNSSNAWMTASIFEDWFHNQFVPGARRHLRRQGLEERGILLLDNCPAHPPADSLVSRDRKFRVVFLPKNTTSRIQPLDQGIISSFKRHYRAALIRSVVAEDTSIVDFLKAMTVKDACYKVATSWDRVTAKSIKATWDSALGNPFDHPCPDEDEEDFFGFTAEDVKVAEAKLAARGELHDLLDAWASVDVDAEVSPPQSLSDFVEEARAAAEPEPEDPEEPEETAPPPQRISHAQALEHAAGLRTYYEQQGDQLMVTQLTTRMMELKRLVVASKKQRTIGDFFKRV